MPRRRKQKNKECECWYHEHHRGRHKIGFGLFLFLIGAMLYYNLTWPVILMVIGALIILKGIIVSK